MDKREFKKLKRRIAINSTLKIIVFSLLAFFITLIWIDFIADDWLANFVYNNATSLYSWCVENKIIIIAFIYIGILIITTYLVIRNSSNNMIEIISAVDSILKEPNHEVHLPDELLSVESQMNNIRVDLISSQNEAKEAMQKKNDLIMYMAHDLKTPLTSIIGYLTLLTDEKEIPKNLQDK